MKKKKSTKLHIVKNPDARVYKDSMRPAIFKDKKHKKIKHKKGWQDLSGNE